MNMPKNTYKKADCINRLKTQISAISANEGLARSLICALCRPVESYSGRACGCSLLLYPRRSPTASYTGIRNRGNPEDYVYITHHCTAAAPLSSRLQTRAAAFQTSSKRWNRCIPPIRLGNAAVWGFPSCPASWTASA